MTSNAGLLLSLGCGKRLDQCEKFNNRTGPAVNQQQRDCVGAGRALMDKINLLSINFVVNWSKRLILASCARQS